MKDDRIVKSVIIKSKARPWESADEVMDMALARAGLDRKDIKNCVGTGYGRDKISFIDEAVSEIACHGRGARWLVPSVRTVIDIGGQDCKAIRLDAKGDMMKFITNDKCASGTGRFLEVMAKVMNLDLDELGEMSARSKQPVTFASACTVWAQADVIQQLNDKVPIEDIAAGVNNAMASRMAILANSIGLENDVCMTGGVAKNNGVVNALEKHLGIRIKRIRREDPQIAGAIGAALFAMEKASGGVI
ncbi:MAG: acyl-CoA dehydratase activase [Spirochaetes bacterium]|nr:acyl-CoA dehydratase activase [Spirochaetota bacterium]